MAFGWRLALLATGLGALAVAVYRYRDAEQSAEEAARVGAIPRFLRSTMVYRIAAVATGGIGLFFTAMAVLGR